MANLSTSDNDSKTLSLISAYEYLTEKGYEGDVVKIRESKDQYKSYTSMLRRGKIVDLMEKKNGGFAAALSR